jgi:hypothetical protein
MLTTQARKLEQRIIPVSKGHRKPTFLKARHRVKEQMEKSETQRRKEI